MVSAGLRRQSQDGGTSSGGKEMTAMMLIVPFYAPAFDSFDFSVCLIWLFGGGRCFLLSRAANRPEGVLVFICLRLHAKTMTKPTRVEDGRSLHVHVLLVRILVHASSNTCR